MSSDQIDLDRVLVRREVDEAELAVVAFLARYSGRTLEAYRQDLRFFFAWTASVGLEVLAATRPHIELFRHHMEQRGLAASTIDRRLATVCLPLGGHRWPDRLESCPVCAAAEGASEPGARDGPNRPRPVSVHSGTTRPSTRSACGAPRVERPTGERGM